MLKSLALAILFPCVLSAQTWSRTSGPEGGNVSSLVEGGGGALYASLGSFSGDGGIVKSTDDGDHWSWLAPVESDNPAISQIAYANGTLYVSSHGRVYTSSDEGVHWAKLQDGPPFLYFLPLG